MDIDIDIDKPSSYTPPRKRYYDNNRELISNKYKLYYENNKDLIISNAKLYYKNNKAEINAKAKLYLINNPDKYLLKKVNMCNYSNKLKKSIIHCTICDKDIKMNYYGGHKLTKTHLKKIEHLQDVDKNMQLAS